MALTVEDGSNVANANSFVPLTYCDSYHFGLGNSTWIGTDTDKEAAIRRATQYLSNSYNWMGYQTHGRNQVLAWPRNDVYDSEGYTIQNDEIPSELMDACCEIALQELVDPNSMNPIITIADKVKSEQVGPIRVEYLTTRQPQDSKPVLLKVTDLIGQFLRKGAGNPFAGTSVRI